MSLSMICTTLLISSQLSTWCNRQFVGELARVAAPGATIIIVTWCHRELGPDEQSLHPWEQDLLKKICDAYYLPAWCSASDYVKLLQSLSLQVPIAIEYDYYVHSSSCVATITYA